MHQELKLYFKTSLFGLVVFGLAYSYLYWMGIPSELNKSLADTAVLLMGFSMILSSVCYFIRPLAWMIVYRKYLGLIGFAFGVAHTLVSWEAFLNLFSAATWQQGKMWPALAGGLALSIFTLMAVISNSFAVHKLGMITWRRILRTGYAALILIWFHVVLLKSARWVTWFNGGMKTLPSLSLLITIFITVVVLMRIFLWWSQSRRMARAHN